MRIIALGTVVWIALLGGAPARAAMPPAAQEELKALVDASRFIDAMALLERNPVEAPEYYYNKGYLTFRLGQTGRSVAFFEKALKLAPADADTRHNLLLARQRRMSEIGVRSLDPASLFFERVSEQLSLDQVRNVLGITAMLLVFAWIRGFRLRKSIVFALFRPVSLILAVVFLSTGAVFFLGKHGGNASVCVALDETVVRSGPGESYTELSKIASGVKVHKLSEEVGGWWQVRYETDAIGWVSNKALLSL